MRHADLIRTADKAKSKLATDTVMHDFEGMTEITVLAPDQPRLLSVIALACTVAGADIVSAQIFTTTTAQALDSIAIRREFDKDEDEARRAKRLTTTIEQALSGDIELREVVAAKARRQSRHRAFSLEPKVIVENSWSDHFTVIEASGLDRSGLLHDLTRAISKLELNIGSAHVGTFGERAVDVFYVTELDCCKIVSGSRKAAIGRRLLKAFVGSRGGQPPGAAGTRRKSVSA